MEQLTIQPLRFFKRFQQDIKVPRPHGTINHTLLGFLIGFQEDIKVPRPHGTINHTVMKVSYRVSGRYHNPPRPHETINHTVIRVSLGFYEDIKMLWLHGTINNTVIRVSSRVSKTCQNHDHDHHRRRRRHRRRHRHRHRHHHRHLACPDARCQPGQTSGSSLVVILWQAFKYSMGGHVMQSIWPLPPCRQVMSKTKDAAGFQFTVSLSW